MRRSCAHAGGLYTYPAGSGTMVTDGATAIWNTGLRSIKIYMTPQYKANHPSGDPKANYPSALETWSSTPTTLTQLAQTTEMATLLGMGWEEIIITTYTFANADIPHFWIPDPSKARLDAEEAEITTLATHLLTTYPGVRFVLQNWEGDWAYMSSTAVDTYVEFNRIARYAAWIAARQRAVTAARVANGGGQIFCALEANRVLDAKAYPHRRRVVRDLSRLVTPDVVSYSAYDSTIVDQGGWGADLAAWVAATTPAYDRALRILSNAFPHSQLQIGEFAFPENEAEHLSPVRDIAPMIQLVNDRSAAAGVKSLVYWQVFDNEASVPYTYRGYWFVKPDGTQSTAGAKFQALGP